MSLSNLAVPSSKQENNVTKTGNYEPYDFWLSTCGIYQLYQYALDLLGDINGKKILDCGCGRGHVSVMLAKRGAIVTGFDTSEEDLSTAKELARDNGVSINFSQQAFEQLDYPDNYFDLVIGTFIIHHVDVTKASQELSRVLKANGKAVYIENSNRNPLLMLARKFLCGSYGIPKYGDDDEEHPLTRTDIKNMRKAFSGDIKVHFPSLVFFRMVDFYILEKRYKSMSAFLGGLDRFFGFIPFMRRLSYFQILECVSKEKTQ